MWTSDEIAAYMPREHALGVYSKNGLDQVKHNVSAVFGGQLHYNFVVRGC